MPDAATSAAIAERDQAIDKARKAKARKIVDEVIRQAIETLSGLSDDDWVILCANAGVQAKTAPSAESKELVFQLLREMRSQ